MPVAKHSGPGMARAEPARDGVFLRLCGRRMLPEALLVLKPGLLREHGQIAKTLKPIPGRSARAVHGAGRFPLLPVFPAP